jgi:hypothetical protein
VRAHHITAGADPDGLDAALGELRAAGWPAPEDPGGDEDAELDGPDLICDHPVDEADWLRQCVGWLTHLHASGFPGGQPAPGRRSSRPSARGGRPPRVAAIVQRIAADIDELARPADLRAERRRVARLDLDVREGARPSKPERGNGLENGVVGD